MRLSTRLVAASSLLLCGLTITTATPLHNPSSSFSSSLTSEGPSIQEVKEYYLDPKGYSPREDGQFGDDLDNCTRTEKRDPRGWVDPAEHGGSLLDVSA